MLPDGSMPRQQGLSRGLCPEPTHHRDKYYLGCGHTANTGMPNTERFNACHTVPAINTGIHQFSLSLRCSEQTMLFKVKLVCIVKAANELPKQRNRVHWVHPFNVEVKGGKKG